jgi:hypothetical protein
VDLNGSDERTEGATMTATNTHAAKHRATGPARHSLNEAVGADGLTDSQRHKLAVRFRAGIGRRSAITPEVLSQVDATSEKLAERAIRVVPRSRR